MKIKVGGVDYTVKALLDDTDAFGHCSAAQQEIAIAPGPSQVQALTLVHEMIHSCFQVFALPTKGLCEEDVCRMLEGPLTAILRDNPRLPGVIRSALTKGKPIV